MAERPDPEPRIHLLPRRTVLGVGVGASVGLAIGAQTPASAHGSKTALSDRHVLYRQFTGAELRAGDHHGTSWRHDGVRIAHPTGSLDYSDPMPTTPPLSATRRRPGPRRWPGPASDLPN
ncbi:hypothetical protein [Microlunatus endophyticus]|uniref:hypothetical protein n=1 Tax=Microlunatus endophyticus TaxID=1716077 RepID=UPI001E306E96|nr:hypothetical protein [Microlunatus endophyticus]